uniref:universal stress protein n=1 Tax=uncultured Draconibacterium sp. TaxID=1573823 RepID=UPI00321771EE
MRQKKIHSILIPVLCPSEINIVLKQALYFHEIYSSTITLLMVIPKLPIINALPFSKRVPVFLRKREAYSKLTLETGKFFNNDLPDFIQIKVEEGKYTYTIQNELNRKVYDLILIKECDDVKKLVNKLKANSENILKRVDCPVMMLHEKWTKTGINEILIPIDITQKCKDSVMWALNHSKMFGARLKFVAIVNQNINVKNSLTYYRSKLIKEWILKNGIDCTFEIIKSSKKEMAQSLLNYAEKGNADLIMLLTHENYIASNNYLGKFAKEIIHNSPKPVISMSIRNKPMFKLLGAYNKYTRKRTETLNIKNSEWSNIRFGLQ